MCPPRPRNRNADREVEDSCLHLRSKLGDDETVPREIHFSNGHQVRLDTNCYDLMLRSDSTLQQYSVATEPEMLDSKMITHFVYRAVCPDGGRMGENDRWQRVIFDGQKILYSALEDLAGEYDIPPREGSASDKVVKVKITHVKAVSPDDRDSMLTIYNVAFRKAYRGLGLENFRRKWLDESQKRTAGSFSIVSGFTPSIASLQGGLTYLIDVASRIDRQGTLYDFLHEGVQNPARREQLVNALKSVQIVTTHRPHRPKQVIVSNVCWGVTASDSTFERVVNRKTGETQKCTIADYFAEVYNYRCKPDDIIVEMVTRGADGQNHAVRFPSSVLKVTGITDAERHDGKVMRDIATVTKIRADVRKERLDAFVRSLKQDASTSQFFEKWGCEIGGSRKLTGMTIQAPKLRMAKPRSSDMTEITLDGRKLGWQQELKNHAMYHVHKFKTPVLVVADERSRDGVEGKFLDGMKKVTDGLNVRIPKMDVRYVSNTHPNDFKRTITEYIKQREVPSFVVVILPTDEKARYDAIKTYLTVDIGLPSQMVKEETVFSDKGLSVFTNIAIQIASKTGGVPFRVSPEDLPTVNTMVVGLAMTSGKISAPVAAGAASTDHGFTQFYSDSAAQDRGDGVINDDFLREFMTAACERYQKVNGSFPERVVVYRDQASYGQMPKIKKREVAVISDTLREVTGNDVCLCYMIAQKHTSIRIMHAPDNKIENAGPGTVVTEGVGAQDVAEFYMISHYANQGSASPTRYTIIHHWPVKWEDDQLVLLTHYQTLQYPNWPGAIRIPACLMLASRLAEFSQQHLGSNKASRNLVDFLHYL